MKKIVFALMMGSFLASCGGGDKDKKDEPKTDENKEASTDLSDNPDYQKGLALVSKPENLCLSCHKIDDKLIGPAYRDVANKYENTPENIAKLAQKVINGGSGVWGEVPMTPHPTLSKEDAESMVKYVLLLKK
jgi:cytochrome c